MKKNIVSFLSIVLFIFILSCNKDITEQTGQLPALHPANQDLNAGSWKTVLLTSAEEFPVAAPVGTTSAVYQTELNEIKSYQRNLTADQRSIIKYWSAGSILRWNEILRELVSIHNLAPYQKEDGTYPAPSASNPFAYPIFPFANPPYAARAYAYVSAAQYDALVAAWHYKQVYNRRAPYTIDSSVQALIPRTDLPSYPSEDGVVAGVTVDMLKLLFPADIAYIQQKADEQKLYRIMCGANTRSEIEAGEALGKLVAAKYASRGKTDKAGQAGGNPAYWKQLETKTEAKGEKCWVSLESPKRPPMLPLFCNVTPFLFDSATVVALRPGPPPSTGSEKFKKETEEVLFYSNNPTRERIRTVHFWADGTGTSTPSGHWDAIAAEEFIKENFSEVRWARNLALLNMSLMDAGIVCWDTKYYYFNPRPSQVDPNIKTLTGLPNFPSYISGHSTFSGAASTVLSHLLPNRGEKFTNLALEASWSRLYGAIHFRSDCTEGLDVGKKIGKYAVLRAQNDGAE